MRGASRVSSAALGDQLAAEDITSATVATRLGNMVKTQADINKALDLAPSIPSIEAVLILIKDKMGAWGNIELVAI